MKVNLLVGARFNGKLVADFLLKNNIDTCIYTSSPPKKWIEESLGRKKIIFIPLIMKIASRLFRIKMPRWIRELDVIAFDLMASVFMRKSDVLHGWATFSYYSAKKHKKSGGIFILDRACPHVFYQEKLLKEEAQKLGIDYAETNKYFIDRCVNEYALADKIIVPSMYTLNSFVEYGVDENKLELVRLDANFSRSCDGIVQKKYDLFVVGSVGGNALRKGFIYLIDAWQSLNLENAQLLLKTSESELKMIPVIWNKIKDDTSIKIVGYVDKIEDFYLQCDVFCLPSVDDGFGMVVFEALACGKPVIASENVGASEMLSHNKTGYVVKNRDTLAIAHYIKLLYQDRELLKDMSLNGFEFYRKNKKKYDKDMSALYAKFNAGRLC